MKLRLAYGTPGETDIVDDAIMATIYIEGKDALSVRVMGPDCVAAAKEIVRAVNFHPSLVAALTPFSSKHMGKLLIDALEASMAEIDSAKGEVVKAKLSKLINAVDVILKGIELSEERDNG